MKAGVLFALLVCSLQPLDARASQPPICQWGHLPMPAVTESRDAAGVASATAAFSLPVYYVVPTNVPYSAAVHARIKQATRDILAWYQCASGGRSWVIEYPETVRVYYAQQTREYYRDNGNWWGSLLGEMGSAGHPIWASGKVTAIWAHGAGWWAGAAQFCGVSCGVALLGVEVFPEFNNPAYSGGNCPGGTGVASWPCTPEGAYAHELGHTVGLPHPADVPATAAVATHSVMQTHWNYPTYAPPGDSPWGFLALERQTIHANPFMHTDIGVVQTHDCQLVNLPVTGPAPVASFTWAGTGVPNTVAFVNASSGASEYYWTFGDGAVSTVSDPTHTYAVAGPYSAKLRAYAANGMMAQVVVAGTVDVDRMPATIARLELSNGNPNPFTGSMMATVSLPRSGLLEASLFAIDGRRVARLAGGYRPAGTASLRWSGQDDAGRVVAPGVYLLSVASGGERASVRIVKVD